MKKKLKVMHIISNLNIGGAETFVTQLVSSFGDDVEVVLVSLFKDENTFLSKKLKENKIEVVYFDKKTGVDFKIVKQLRRFIKSWKPDIINTHLNTLVYSLLATRFIRKKPILFHTIHNIATEDTTKNKQRLYKIFFHYYHVYPIGISKIIKESIESRYRLKNVVFIDNGVDYNRFKGSKRISSRKYDLIHVARFSYQKNHEFLIRAFKIASCKIDAHLFLIGKGELEDETKKLVSALGIDDRVTFLGLRNDVNEIMKDAKIFLLPSRFEGNPISLLEAMSAGCVCIATPVGGVPDILEDKVNGFLASDDENDLSDIIVNTYQNGAIMQEISTKNIEYASKFEIKEVAKRYAELYKSKMKVKKDDDSSKTAKT